MTARKPPSAAPLSPCPVEHAINIIGGKWKMLVLRSLLLGGPQRYNQLLRGVSGISPKELTRNLAELRASGLVTQAGSAGVRTPQYSLTSLGQGLMPAFRNLLVWGRKLICPNQG
ncbi:MAG: helix-turn-helix domain-containing protein [Acidobacteriaceae bacterium]